MIRFIGSGDAIDPLSHIIRLRETAGKAGNAPADGKSDAIEFGQHRECRFIGDIVADEHRTAPAEWRMHHQVANAGMSVLHDLRCEYVAHTGRTTRRSPSL